MSTRAAQIQDVREALKAKRAELTHLRWMGDDPEVRRLYELIFARQRVIEAERQPALKALETEVAVLARRLAALRQPATPPPFPEVTPELEEWFREVRACSAHGHGYRIVWTNPDESLVIVHHPGTHYFSGTGMQSYSRSAFVLYHPPTSNHVGMAQPTALCREGGRWGKALVRRLAAKLGVDSLEKSYRPPAAAKPAG